MFDSFASLDPVDLDWLNAPAPIVDSAEHAEALQTELEALRRRIEVSMAEVLSGVAKKGLYQEDGCGSVSSWLRKVLNVSAPEAKRLGRVADVIHAHPCVGDRLRAGTLGVAQATRLAGLHANPRVSGVLPEFLPTLVGYAESLPFEDFNTVAIRWEQLADADGAHREHEAVHASREAGVHTVGSVTYVDARLGNAQGSMIAEVFEKYVQAELARDLAGVEPGSASSCLARTSKQRRADAMFAVFASAADRFLPAPEPLVNILIDQETYERTLAAMEAGERIPPLVDPSENLLDKRCETSGGVVLDPVGVVSASLVGQVRRVVMNAAGVPVDLGRRARIFSGGARAAALLRRRRCIWPGCDVLTCEVDHLVPWSEGGTTSADNADPLCRRHNRLKTAGYQTTYDPRNRHTGVQTPTGRHLAPVWSGP